MSRWFALFLVIGLFCLGAHGSRAQHHDRPNPLLFGLQFEGYPLTIDRLIDELAHSGVLPSLVGFYRQWPASHAQDLDEFPEASFEAIRALGAVPVLTWEPMVVVGTETHAIFAEEILGGRYDPYLKRWARAARKWGHPLVIRFAHEMNLIQYHWGTTRQQYGPASPRLFRRMWRYVVGMFRREGATQVLWAFCPNHQSDPRSPGSDGRPWNTLENWFPGRAWVDLMGVDGYNWGQTRTMADHGWDSSWTSFTELFAEPVATLRRLAPDKPFLIWEVGCTRREATEPPGWPKLSPLLHVLALPGCFGFRSIRSRRGLSRPPKPPAWPPCFLDRSV
jgi:mannan endo-1,4-beta-mannosidase